uniref:Protein kinase domain-containing protein n=2 Tax=Trichobilharzia regenti TaxID=157069 RepID=A0AA85K599_TRIRE|nr:unnamed protein product [Trichobilharzia regenti]
MQVEIILLVITIFGLSMFCLMLIILHHKTATVNHTDQYTRHLRCGYFTSSAKFIKCINLCQKFCKLPKTSLSHDFDCEDNLQKPYPLSTSITKNNLRLKSLQTPVKYDAKTVLTNHHLPSKFIYQSEEKKVKRSQNTQNCNNPPPTPWMMMMFSNEMTIGNINMYKASESSFSCSHLDEMLDPFDSIDDSSHLDSLLDQIPNHRLYANTSRRLDSRNLQSKTLALKYKNYLSKIKQSSTKSDRHEIKLSASADANKLLLFNQQKPNHSNSEHLQSPWVKANKATEDSVSNSDRSNQSSSSSIPDDIQLSVCSKARDPTNILADLHIPSHKIILDDVILRGTFSRLYEGKMLVTIRRHGVLTNKWKKVLVKTLTEKATEEQVRVFINDACKLVGVKHSQIATVIAASDSVIHTNSCSNHQTVIRPILIYSNAKYSNLKLFLQRKSKGIHDGKLSPNMILTATQLINMGLQILSAVGYLHNINVIHEDIATRNCVIKGKTRIALSDSALSRDLFPEDYHCLGDNTNRPVKWLAHEALIERKYNKATDVWSVGITLWELITKGQQPYANIDAFEMPAVLRSGYRLKKPQNCPDDLWKIIYACWKANPSSRPTVSQLITRLEAFKVAVTNYI